MSFLRKAYSHSERMFPRFSRLLRRMILVVTGKYFDRLAAENARQFDRLARCLEAQPELTFIFQDGQQRLAGLDAAPNALAVVSALPPEQTGLANFTLRTFRAAGYPVDIFSHFTDIASYLSLACDESLAAAGITFLPISLLPAARVRRRYFAQIFEIGNSHHNLPVLASATSLATFPTDIPTFVHIHDPCLLNLLRRFVDRNGLDFSETISQHYGTELARDDDRFLIQNGVFGPRALFSAIQGVHLLTNSVAAQEHLARDWPEARERQHVLFHPVFAPNIPRRAKLRDTIRIGTFGIPSAAKRSEVVVSAFRLLAKKIENLELVIAGYHATAFARWLDLEKMPSIKIFDSPSDEKLLELMQSCDLAVQLRLENLGESSGVVPQLISLGVPVIVSRIGAFAEYGEAAAWVPPGCGAETLADAISSELRMAGGRSEAQRRYAEAHTPAAFCRELRLLADGLAPQMRVVESVE